MLNLGLSIGVGRITRRFIQATVLASSPAGSSDLRHYLGEDATGGIGGMLFRSHLQLPLALGGNGTSAKASG